VEGATVRLLPGGAPTDPPIETVTDNQGRFLLEDVPAGRAQLIVDGGTANRLGDWIKLTYEIDIIAGIENGLGMSVYLLPVGENATVVQNGGPAQDITLTMADIPGAEVTIRANSVTCPPGLSECVVSWTQINAERMAMPPPMGSIVMLGWTLQPTGAKFNPPVDICIPNMDMPPGMQVEMFNWDYGLMDWATVGTATITEDGAQLCSDPGFGIPSAGWGCCVPPPPPKKCAQSCDDGNRCTDDACVNGNCEHTPLSTPQNVANMCEGCNNGTPVPKKTDAQCCGTVSFGGGFVVCCNGNQTACAGSSFNGTSKGITILRQCALEHEKAHFGHVDCPRGAGECNTTRPPFKPGQDPAQGECDGSKVEVACLRAANCGSDAACQQSVNSRITQIRGYGNGFVPGCIP